MEKWQKLLAASVSRPEQFVERLKQLGVTDEEIEEIKKTASLYPMRINPYYLSLIREKGDAIWKQCIPDKRELEDENSNPDPLEEEKDSKTPCLVHKYPDRVLLLVSNECAMYCRFCTRKRRVGDLKRAITEKDVMDAIEYIKRTPQVRDVLLSGGDPLLLPDEVLERYLRELRAIPHVEIIRIGTRTPATLPQRITPKLCRMLKKYHPLYINTHFEHPSEITEESARACAMLADAGIPLGNQSVVLKGVNDDPRIMKELFQKLLKIRVKPYYLYQCDPVRGVAHFRTRIEKGLEIIRQLRGHTTGMAVPQYVVDTPGGKVPLLPEYTVKKDGRKYVFKSTFDDNEHEYLEGE